MEYEKLVFEAPVWREIPSLVTDVLTVKAEFAILDCMTIAEPVPGSDPIQIKYSCKNITCDGNCKLTKETDPNGNTIIYCACGDSDSLNLLSTSRATSRASTRKKTAKKGAKKGTKAPKKTAKKGKRKGR